MRAYLALHGGPSACAIAFLAAFALTLVLAAWLTPGRWWRRPTLRGATVLAGGTLAFGTLLLALAGRPQAALAAASVPVDAMPQSAQAAASVPADAMPQAGIAPAPGTSYRVAEDLNLRATRGVHAARLAVLPAGSRVVASGAFDGDWWQVRVRVNGRELAGWTSSLWLRRSDEAHVRGHPGA